MDNALITIRNKAVEIAIGQLGQKEEPIGSNCGPMVNEYLKSVGLNPGYAWCQAFVFWCYAEAAKALGLPNPVIHTASVLDCWNRTAVNFKLMAVEVKARPELVSPGDQIIFKHSATTGHTGIIERIEGQLFYTIEGNTNHDGSREGYEVERKIRRCDDLHLLGVIRY